MVQAIPSGLMRVLSIDAGEIRPHAEVKPASRLIASVYCSEKKKRKGSP